jgi:hypothetical protein
MFNVPTTVLGQYGNISNRLKNTMTIPMTPGLRSGRFPFQKAENPDRAETKTSKKTTREIVDLINDWLSVNHSENALTSQQRQQLAQEIGTHTEATAENVWDSLKTVVPKPLAEKTPSIEALETRIKKMLTGSKQAPENMLLKCFVVFQYVPSTITTIITTVLINRELRRKEKINEKEERLLNNQEFARQGVGAAIHFGQAAASFALVDVISYVGKQSPVLQKAGKEWLAKTEGNKGWNTFVGNTLNKTADTLRNCWNKLNEGSNKTGLGLAFVMLSNLLSYGIMRPLIVNTTFMGITDATAPTADKGKKPLLASPSYVEQVRLSVLAERVEQSGDKKHSEK